jgi:hypothetical protein
MQATRENVAGAIRGAAMTVGWIREKDEERFYEATDHVPAPITTVDQSKLCPFCGARLPSVPALYDHLHRAHVVQRPILLLGGSEPVSNQLVSRIISPREIVLLQCSSVELAAEGADLHLVGEAEFRRKLASQRDGILRVRIANRGDGSSTAVHQDYRLRFRIASAAELKRVDKTFVNYFGAPGPHLATVDHFMSGIGSGPWEDYARGLADYVVGVLSKDKDRVTGIKPPFTDYRHHFNRSLSVLACHERPLSVLLQALMRLALNDFSKVSSTAFEALDATTDVLTRIAVSTSVPEPPQLDVSPDAKKAVCPVDAGTSLVISAATRLMLIERWGPVEQETIVASAGMEAISALDRAKILALGAWTALRLGHFEEAKPLLQRLSGNDCFSEWAISQLETCDG